MSPEQLSDKGVDARSDLFSLGVVLYFMLTGQRPFQGNSIATVCFKVANHEPLAVATYDMSFPPELDLVVSRAIAKNPAERYQSGAEMASDIQRLRESSGFIQKSDQQAEPVAHPLSDTAVRAATAALSWPASSRTWIFAAALLATALVSAIYLRTSLLQTPKIGPPPSDSFVLSQPAGSPIPPRPADAELHLEIEHPFTAARASVWLDNQLVYTQLLHANPKNPLLVFRKPQGHESHKVELPSGIHRVRVRVQSQATAYDQSRTLALTLAPKGERTLRVNCDKKHNLLQLTLQ